jgi:F0F1-type ATP synthase assembly protein I
MLGAMRSAFWYNVAKSVGKHSRKMQRSFSVVSQKYGLCVVGGVWGVWVLNVDVFPLFLIVGLLLYLLLASLAITLQPAFQLQAEHPE